VLAGITTAWDTGRMPPTRFADEYVQHAISCYELDEDAASQALAALRQRARTDPFARTIIRAVDSYRDQRWRPTTVLPVPEASPLARGTVVTGASITAPANPRVPEDVLTVSLDRLIAAESVGAATAAARGLKQVTEPYCRQDSPWQVLAQASTEALARASFVFAAKLGLAAAFWRAFFRTEMMASGLPQVPTSALLPILLNCFEACTHLPERTVIGADAQSIFDVEDTRNRCQDALSDLPVADYLTTTPRNRLTEGPGRSLVPDPSDDGPAEGGPTVALRKRVFISYVHEDAESVDRLASTLIANGFDAWLDRTHLKPGMRWRSVISREIRTGDYVIACFSPSYVSKNETFMNEELIIAINRLRRMHRSRQWFFSVKLAECDIPDYEIGPGETLNDLQYVDLSRDWDTGVKILLAALSTETS
jgi:hypothetical protein